MSSPAIDAAITDLRALPDDRHAEHGGGYTLMATIKRAVDPHNIMNPGKLVNLN